AHGRRVPAAVRARELRPLRPRSHGRGGTRRGLRRGRPARGREAHGERLPAARGRHRGHGRAHPGDPEGRGAAAGDGTRGPPPRGVAVRRRPRGVALRGAVRAHARMSDYDVGAFFAHPDDAEIVAGGTLAREAARGRRVAVVDLTRGESGSRGTPETRAAEAAEAARTLGAAQREALGLPDGRLADDAEQRDAVVAAIRRLRPRIVILPHWEQRHPDHTAAGRLVYAASFLAGLRNYRTDVGAAF